MASLTFLIAAVLSFPALWQMPGTGPVPAGDAVLRVDGTPIAQGHFEDWLVRTRGESLARRFVQQWLVRREAQRLAIGAVTERVEARVKAEIDERVERAFGGRREAWLEELERAGRSERGRVLERSFDAESEILLEEITRVDRMVPMEKIRRDWERQYGREGRRLDVRVLFRRLAVPSVPGRTRAEQEAERDRLKQELFAEVSRIRRRAVDGEDFAELARALSDDASTRGSGGIPAPGFFTFGWPTEQIDAIAAMRPEEISEPIFARGGYWLVQLLGIEITPLEEVEDEIRAALIERGPEPDETGATLRRLWGESEHELLPAALLAPESETQRRPVEEPVLRIDGEPVSRGELGRWLRRYHGEMAAPRFAEQWAIRRRATEAGIATTEMEVLERVAADIEREIEFYFGGERDKWLAAVLGTGRTMESLERERAVKARSDLLIEGLLKRERVITDAMVEAAWTDRYGRNGRSLDVRWIRVDAKPEEPSEGAGEEELKRLVDEALAAAKERALGLIDRIEAGEDFATLARQHSDDAGTRDRGGEAPDGFRLDSLPDQVEQALLALRAGAISEPLRVLYSYFVFEVTAVRVVPLDEVRAELRRELEESRPSMVEVAGYRNVLMQAVRLELLPAMYD